MMLSEVSGDPSKLACFTMLVNTTHVYLSVVMLNCFPAVVIYVLSATLARSTSMAILKKSSITANGNSSMQERLRTV